MSQNGWNIVKPRSISGGVMGRYKDRYVVILMSAHRLCLSPLIVKHLGNPKRIEVRTRGSNIGLFLGGDGDFKLIYPDPGKGATPYITIAALSKSWNIQPGVYDVYVESDGVVFDTQQKPSKVR